MTSISNNSAAATFQLPMTLPPREISLAEPFPSPSQKGRGNEEELRERFTQFVGETFFGQMLKAMRSTVGKPAYFHGGRAEEVFQSQLDQTMAEHLTEASASKFGEPMFERQFPQFAESARPSELNQLAQLRRR